MSQRLRMTAARWGHLLWVHTGRTLNHAVRPNVMKDLEEAGLVRRTDGKWEVTPTMGKGIIEMERQHLERLCRRDHGMDVNSVYFDAFSQHWIANVNTPRGTDLAYVARDGKDKITVFRVR